MTLSGALFSAVLVESVDALVVEDSVGRHEIFVEVAALSVLPLSVVQKLVADVHLEVNLVEVCQVSLCPEVVSQVNLGLLGRGPVLAALGNVNISWIFKR